MDQETLVVMDENELKTLAARLAKEMRVGDVVLLDGPLGAGKTTFVRGVLTSFGFLEPVRSPTFNLIQTFDTEPKVMHADLYRLRSYDGIGLEEYMDTHLCFIEWPDRAVGLVEPDEAWFVHIDFRANGRTVRVKRPSVC